jgi:hypothetical protein
MPTDSKTIFEFGPYSSCHWGCAQQFFKLILSLVQLATEHLKGWIDLRSLIFPYHVYFKF